MLLKQLIRHITTLFANLWREIILKATCFRAGRAPTTNTSVPPFATSCCARNGCVSRCLLRVACGT